MGIRMGIRCMTEQFSPPPLEEPPHEVFAFKHAYGVDVRVCQAPGIFWVAAIGSEVSGQLKGRKFLLGRPWPRLKGLIAADAGPNNLKRLVEVIPISASPEEP